MPEWEREYHTAMFGVDQGNGIVYAVYREGAKITNKQGWMSDEESLSETESEVLPPRTRDANGVNPTHCFSPSTSCFNTSS